MLLDNVQGDVRLLTVTPEVGLKVQGNLPLEAYVKFQHESTCRATQFFSPSILLITKWYESAYSLSTNDDCFVLSRARACVCVCVCVRARARTRTANHTGRSKFFTNLFSAGFEIRHPHNPFSPFRTLKHKPRCPRHETKTCFRCKNERSTFFKMSLTIECVDVSGGLIHK